MLETSKSPFDLVNIAGIVIEDALHSVLQKLRYVAEARFDDGRSGRVECLASTRNELLSFIRSWMRPNGENDSTSHEEEVSEVLEKFIMWMNGLAGSGKSTIAQTIASWCNREKILGASFFCARTGGRSDVQLIFPTIAHQLSRLSNAFAEEVVKALDNNDNIYSAQPSIQLEELIVNPLKAASGSFPAQVVIIDALDECRDDAAVSVILVALSQFVGALYPLKFLITSRPEPRIVEGFRRYDTLLQHTHSLLLNEIPVDIVDRDIKLYIDERLGLIKKAYPDLEGWPSIVEKEQLAELTYRVFVFISTALNFIEDTRRRSPRARLKIVLGGLRGHKDSPFAYLDGLYVSVVDDAIPEDADPDMVEELMSVLGSVVLLRDQLSPQALDSLLGFKDGTSTRILESLGSVISLPQSAEGVIQIIHPSFPDFLVDPDRCTKPTMVVHPKKHHATLAERCLTTMVNAFCESCATSELTWCP